MTNFVSPARSRYPRSGVTGEYPSIIPTGSLALNLTDRKLFTGDDGGNPVLMSQLIREWNVTQAYQTDDLVIHLLGLWRARHNISPGTGFSTVHWEAVATDARASFSSPSATGMISGGIVTLTAGFTDRISVAAGSAVVVNADDPANVQLYSFSWAAFDYTISNPGASWSVVGINQNGALSLIDYINFDHRWRRDYVSLAFVAWNGLAIRSVVDASVPAYHTATAFLDQFYDRDGAYRSTGVLVSAGTGMNLAVSAGTIFNIGDTWRGGASPNTRAVPATSKATLIYFQDGQADVVKTVVDPSKWFNGTAIVDVPVGMVTTQFVGLSPSNQYYVRYGKTLYSSPDLAIADIANAYGLLQSPTIPLAALILPQGITNLLTQGLIAVADTHGDPYDTNSVVNTSSFLLLDGSRAMKGNLNLAGFGLLNAVIDGGTF